jgi:hypothetical protein
LVSAEQSLELISRRCNFLVCLVQFNCITLGLFTCITLGLFTCITLGLFTGITLGPFTRHQLLFVLLGFIEEHSPIYERGLIWTC